MELAEAASRRRFLKHAAVAACASLIAPSLAKGEKPPRQSFQRVVDLTHTLSASFPLTWPNPFVMEQVSKLGKDKWNAYRWHITLHAGLERRPYPGRTTGWAAGRGGHSRDRLDQGGCPTDAE